MDVPFEESGMRFNFTDVISAVKADNPSYNGLSSVDFIVEVEDCFLFIEVKNPDNKKAHPDTVEKFRRELDSSAFYYKISSKLKDTVLRALAQGKSFGKPIKYIFLFEFQRIDTRQRLKIFEKIKGSIPPFKEASIYTAVSGITFYLYDVSAFRDEFPKFLISVV